MANNKKKGWAEKKPKWLLIACQILLFTKKKAECKLLGESQSLSVYQMSNDKLLQRQQSMYIHMYTCKN